MVGLAGFEPTVPGTQNQNHTKLDHNPNNIIDQKPQFKLDIIQPKKSLCS